MQQQKSFEQENEKGILYLVPTPIGNLEDMTFRAIRIMKEADLIAAEDTRNTKKLCNYFEIETPVSSYHEHNKESSGHKIIEKIKEGAKVALVSDAGMPTISDPGAELVVEAIAARLTVVPLPGANAALTALIASGIQPQPFYYYGFLQRGKKDKKKEIELLSKQTGTIVLYESPHRLKETLSLMLDGLGDRNIVLCRELTKKFEEFIRGTISEVLAWAESEEIRGEFVLVIEGASLSSIEVAETHWWETLSLSEHVEHYISKENMNSKAAIKQTAKDRDMQKRDVYQAYHISE
ncbi:16S rRNA (cytidine(1402)-2'-O)-methyltransferase [Mesobacillus subterraneus]|uniref:16S rRNA (cytidine(1402)-2'-O)-methyltransferase n=1 Tax=Mesobacillus subterraneus TaxID=285983 RepID=UPI00204064E2|nr:16S rRNA (cytidine(1402)-2'-O)-methyltransferase [Mesobacillus subterraneus]MCM3667121.1 16S rRNA (cytidine(1402)-2'-O)-methyltransferase [Mesobacillus subterraneus]MCM3685861.1 16S rRNA (cytidine(1402)-2'-O)-methyltransferase [Mesobacillus subterraneus]